MPTLHLSQDPDAGALLSADPLALLLGMALDQRNHCRAINNPLDMP